MPGCPDSLPRWLSCRRASRLTAALCLALLLAGVTGCSGHSTIAPVDARSLSAQKEPQLDGALARIVRELRFPGAVALRRTPTGTWHGATGFSNLRTKTAMRPDDRFRIGSVTKTFLATIVLQLAGEGRLHLDDKVARWFPGLVPYARAITVRELLNHTSGLFDYL